MVTSTGCIAPRVQCWISGHTSVLHFGPLCHGGIMRARLPYSLLLFVRLGVCVDFGHVVWPSLSSWDYAARVPCTLPHLCVCGLLCTRLQCILLLCLLWRVRLHACCVFAPFGLLCWSCCPPLLMCVLLGFCLVGLRLALLPCIVLLFVLLGVLLARMPCNLLFFVVLGL